MNRYITGAVIRRLREKKKLTQEELAKKIYVSSKAVSKWETGAGFPDISLIEPLAEALGISVIELLNGEDIQNTNPSSNMIKSSFYVCPVCGNIIQSAGQAVVSCCGVTLPPLEAEECDCEHRIIIETVEDEYYVHLDHPMSKAHYISFIAAVFDDGVQFIKLYPEGNAEARFKKKRIKFFYAYCNRNGLYYRTLQ
ncbi:MAG: helix-turn-helix domain-containing protein [Eubacterium sp.]|nr:helix-turn-helix domain-containing protein [Eubacterium sp.]